MRDIRGVVRQPRAGGHSLRRNNYNKRERASESEREDNQLGLAGDGMDSINECHWMGLPGPVSYHIAARSGASALLEQPVDCKAPSPTNRGR